MPFANYTELQAEVIRWLGERTDLVPQVPAFIAIAEETLRGELRCRELHERAQALLTEEYEFLPLEFAKVDHVVVQDGNGSRKRLNYRTMQQLDSVDESHVHGQTDLPEAFSIIGGQIRFSPPPTAFVTPPGVDPDLNPELCRNFELMYWQRCPTLSDANPVNVVLQTYPSLYLFASLIAAEPYLLNDPRVALWIQQYTAALERANAMDKLDTVASLVIGVPQ